MNLDGNRALGGLFGISQITPDPLEDGHDSDRITAGELRAMGFPIRDDVPDCATIRKGAWRVELDRAIPSPDRMLSVPASITFDEPFEWVQVDLHISTAPGEAA